MEATLELSQVVKAVKAAEKASTGDLSQEDKEAIIEEAKNEIAEMPVSRLRENIASFLDNHPEYCDEFLK